VKRIKLTDRAFEDLAEIENYSIKQFGNKVADKYLNDIESGLNMLQENSGLLQDIEGFSARLNYYRIRDHFLICSEVKAFILVVTIKHVQMDIINRLAELEPTLVMEAELLFKRL
jgi:plasmid stabilization system protein ParE